jgi:hypothetical protein
VPLAVDGSVTLTALASRMDAIDDRITSYHPTTIDGDGEGVDDDI